MQSTQMRLSVKGIAIVNQTGDVMLANTLRIQCATKLVFPFTIFLPTSVKETFKSECAPRFDFSSKSEPESNK